MAYKPLTSDTVCDKAVFVQNIHGQFDWVLDVKGEEYSVTPYSRVGDFVPRQYHGHFPNEILNVALVNNN